MGCRRSARVQDRLAPAARGADDHRGVRTPQHQARDVDDVGHRHVGTAGDGEVDLERGGERREQNQDRERQDGGQGRARQEHRECRSCQRDYCDDVPACAGRQVPEQGALSISTESRRESRPSLLSSAAR